MNKLAGVVKEFGMCFVRFFFVVVSLMFSSFTNQQRKFVKVQQEHYEVQKQFTKSALVRCGGAVSQSESAQTLLLTLAPPSGRPPFFLC